MSEGRIVELDWRIASTVATLVAAVASIVAVVISAVALRRSKLSEAKRQEFEEAVFRREAQRSTKDWSRSVIEQLTKALVLSKDEPLFMDKYIDRDLSQRQSMIEAELSSLLEEGMLFLPSTDGKETTYRGLGVAAVNHVFDGLELVRSLQFSAAPFANQDTHEQLQNCIDGFTREIGVQLKGEFERTTAA